MMKFDPKIHHRRSIRLKGYDYCMGSFVLPTCYAAGTKPDGATGWRIFVTILPAQGWELEIRKAV